MCSSSFAPLLAPTLLYLVGACASAAPPEAQPGTPASATHVQGDVAAPQEAHASPAGAAGEAPAAAPAAAPTAAPASTPAGTAGEVPPEAAPPIEPRSVVLHIGDSFLMAGFSQALRPKMKAVGALYEVRSEQASYTTSWHLKLAKLVGDYHPDLVIINLGANEVTLTDPAARADAVERLVKIVGDRPCVWVSPPLWRKDTGIIEIFRKHTSPCRFFDSDAYAGPISRQPDGIHPDAAGGTTWADAFFRWLLAERAPLPKEGEALPKGSGRHAVNPWRLRPEKNGASPSPSPQKTAQTQP
ncbi:SGNH/GDSL hydrolase family protein [Polyangium mundeleinium]|uniref:SGNH/GDSL hydrolase family protein n=1 Tax=Polyangium mundeleinium TaxID=2995306 RepID=A0ABT5ES87_9BACT|nr:SGNH/GDSL hydrolase family protein [Polyangium mundeleinium]MDC0744232.1 SGNH/GDSL hydrolase family protein [Polyangium mundeleinium]